MMFRAPPSSATIPAKVFLVSRGAARGVRRLRAHRVEDLVRAVALGGQQFVAAEPDLEVKMDRSPGIPPREGRDELDDPVRVGLLGSSEEGRAFAFLIGGAAIGEG
jgi:hypothetical protein